MRVLWRWVGAGEAKAKGDMHTSWLGISVPLLRPPTTQLHFTGKFLVGRSSGTPRGADVFSGKKRFFCQKSDLYLADSH
jgi:hypothetical protein